MARKPPLFLTASPNVVLERSEVVPALIGRHEDFLIISGLGGTACDVGAVARRSPPRLFARRRNGRGVHDGLGLALARTQKRVLVVTGDGELLMNIGALASIAVIDPPNLAILCVDNGHYGETGWQKSHTSLGVDLEKIAVGCGIKHTHTVSTDADVATGARLLRESNGAAFVVARVKPTEPPAFKRNFDAAFCRDRFRAALPSL